MLRKVVFLFVCVVALVWLGSLAALHLAPHRYAQLSADELARADAYLQGKLEPIPEAWQWQRYSPEAGIDLRTGLLDNPNAKGTVIVVPGFTGSIEMVMHEIVRLHAAGYRVASIEYRGQGDSYRPLSHPEKGYLEDYAELAADVAGYARQIRRAEQPLYFFSISKGAHITMRMAAEQDIDVSAYALIVPMIQINTGDLPYAQVATLANVLTQMGFGSMYAPGQAAWPARELVWGQPEGCNANPDTAQTQSALFARRPELRTSGTTVRWLHETMDSTERLLDPTNVAAIAEPVMMFTAGIDELVSTEAAAQFCSTLSDCTLQHYPDARHCITREDMTLYDGIIDQAISHFDQHRG